MKIPADKRAHFVTGALLAVMGMAVFCVPIGCLFGRASFAFSLVIPLLAVAGAAVLKEILDHRDPAHHTSDPLDALATICGGLLVLVPALLLALPWGTP